MSPLKWKIITILILFLFFSVGLYTYLYFTYFKAVIMPILENGGLDPNSTSWWIIGIPTKYCILFFLIGMIVIILIALWLRQK